MTMTMEIPAYIPRRNAVAALQQHLINQILQQRPDVGTLMMSADEMAEHFGVSRSTMNRVMDALQKQGWIERRVGQGTFIGTRAELTVMPPSQMGVDRDINKLLRLAVAVMPLEHSSQNWHAQGLLNGIDQAASEGDVAIELLGQCGGDHQRFVKRLTQTRPDVLAILKPLVQSAPVLGEAQRLNIPSLMTGTHLRELGVPSIYEDGKQGAALAVQHLVALGHKKIGFIVPDEPLNIWFDRRHGYEKAMVDAGLELDQNLIHRYIGGYGNDSEGLGRYLMKIKPTAVVVAAGPYMESFTPLIRSGQVRIPDQLSVVTFDQCFEYYKAPLENLAPTYIELPLLEMGKSVVERAKQLVCGENVNQYTVIPCRLVEGATAKRLSLA